MLEVGGEIVNLGGAVVVEEEVDTTVHEVEVLVSDLNTPPSSSSKGIEEEDSIQDEESKEQVESPETELQDESQVEDEADTPTTWFVHLHSRNSININRNSSNQKSHHERNLMTISAMVARNRCEKTKTK